MTAWLGAGAALAGCKTNNISQTNNTESVTATIGPEGGTLQLTADKSSVKIPPGALSQATTLTFRIAPGGFPAFPGVADSAVYSIEPHEVAFAVAATVSLTGNASDAVERSDGTSSWQPLPSQTVDGLSAAQTLGGGFFALAAAASNHTGAADGGVDPGGGDAGGARGTVVRSDLGSGVQAFAVDDTNVYYVQQTTDSFGAKQLALESATLRSMAAPTTVATLNAQSTGTNVAFANGNVYWNDGQGGMAGTLYRAAPGGSAQSVTSIGRVGGFARSGDDILFVDASNDVRRYDTKAGTLDPTTYGSVTQGGPGAFIASTATNVYWLNGGGGTPYSLWSAADGSPGAATSATISGNAQLTSFGAFGANAYVTAMVNPATNVIAIDPATGTPKTITSFPLSGGALGQSSMLAYDNGYLFAASYANGGQYGALVRVSLADGTTIHVGSYLAEGMPRPIAVSATSVYVLEPNSSGGAQVTQFAKP